jgi:hypothetical protein
MKRASELTTSDFLKPAIPPCLIPIKINRAETPYGWVPWRQDLWELDIKLKNRSVKIESIGNREADYAEILSAQAEACLS